MVHHTNAYPITENHENFDKLYGYQEGGLKKREFLR